MNLLYKYINLKCQQEERRREQYRPAQTETPTYVCAEASSYLCVCWSFKLLMWIIHAEKTNGSGSVVTH